MVVNDENVVIVVLCYVIFIINMCFIFNNKINY